MPTSKANTNTITKIEPDAIPPSFSSSVLLCFPKKAAAYNPAEINARSSELSLIGIEPIIPEDHESFQESEIQEDSDNDQHVIALKRPILQ